MQAPLVKELGEESWGVHAAIVRLPYFARDAEPDLISALKAGEPALVLGPSLAGKTRMASEVIRGHFPERRLIIPDVPDGLSQLMDAGEVPLRSVIWLDDLDRYLSIPTNLKTRWMDDLVDAENVIVATMRESVYQKFQPTEDLPRTQWETLRKFRVVRIRETEEERERLALATRSVRLREGVSQHGIGTYVGGGFIAVERLESAYSSHPIAAALIRIAVDWERSGIGEFVPKDTAISLLKAYLPPRHSTFEQHDLEESLRWATDRSTGAGAFRLITVENGRLRPFDFLVDHESLAGSTIPSKLWEFLSMADVTGGQLNTAGTTALLMGESLHATTIFERAAAFGDADAMANLAFGLERQDQLDEAEELMRRSASAGSSAGMTGLALILTRRGENEEGEALFLRAAELGRGDAMANLGSLASARGDLDAGFQWYQKAVAAGSPLGMTNLATHLEKRGLVDEAELLYRQAAAQGNGAGMYEIGRLLEGRGEAQEAEHWYFSGARNGSPIAMSKCGQILYDKGRREEAEEMFVKAAHRGDFAGLNSIGEARAKAGDHTEAERLFKMAASFGNALAMRNLGVLFNRQGRDEEARVHYQRAIDAGDTDSISFLGANLFEANDLEQAEALFQQGIDRGSTHAMWMMGRLLIARHLDSEARRILEKAAEAADPRAITELGRLEAIQGHLEQAERLLKEAAAMGDEYGRQSLEQFLADTAHAADGEQSNPQ